MLKKVVLPAPFGPIRLTIDRSGMMKSTSLTAIRPPNSLRTRSARRRSATPDPVLAVAPERRVVFGVVQRQVGDGLLELALVPPLGYEAGGAQQHHGHDDDAVDPELVLRDVLDPEIGADRREAGHVQPAEDHHAQQEDRDVEEEVGRKRAALEARVERAGDAAEERSDRVRPRLSPYQ